MLLSGKEIAKEILEQIKNEIKEKAISPYLAIIVIGNQNASSIYVKKKIETAKEVGIKTRLFSLPENVKEETLEQLIKKINKNRKIHGVIVQLPLPPHISQNKIFTAIDPKKDVDGFHPLNRGKLFLNEDCFVPCTPNGIMKLLEHYKIRIDGKNTVIIGRSNLVGKPLALLLLHKNATITICHSKTKNLNEYVKKADLIIAAVGKPGLLKDGMIKKGACIIDVGISLVNGKIVGDVSEKVKEKANVSPVPGGVGPLTVAMLLKNTLKAALLNAPSTK